MSSKLKENLWKFNEARKVRSLDRAIFLGLTIAGLMSMFNLMEWWFREEHIENLFLFIILSLFFGYGNIRIALIWINYLRIQKPKEVPVPEKNLHVAVFTTSSPGEPLSMFENTFKALKNLNYPHTAYLLDDTGDPAFKELAEEHGVVWLDLPNIPGAKAGKVNEALKRTKEDFILILDPDHIVFPNFLDQTLGFFQDEKVGFVQVSQGYYNMFRSFTAQGAAEQTYTFYGPTQMGLFGYGGAVAIGANCTFRRKTLESIGGHATGLSEDLNTSIRIHSKGWKSIYNPVIVSRGLVPEDFTSYCKQQLKWARGVFEMLFDEFPKASKNLTFWQKLSYISIGTYYLVGPLTAFFIFIPLLFFTTKILPASMDFSQFIILGSPIVIIAILIYAHAQNFFCDTKTEKGIHWRGMVLKYSCWPVFTYAFYLSIINKQVPYIPTAKVAVKGFMSPFVAPLIIYCILFIFLLTGVYIERRYYIPESELILTTEKTWGMMGFALLAFVQFLGGIVAAYKSLFLKAENAWDKILITEDKQFKIK
jgi:cellulose synthase (UDP-forming)